MASSGVPRVSATVALQKPALQQVFDNLRAEGYTLIGPTVRDAAIILDEIQNLEQLPRGWTDEKAPGRYRLKQAADSQYFAHSVGPHAWKRYLFPPRTDLLKAQKTEEGWQFESIPPSAPRSALIGVRPCDVAAIGIQDKVFLGGAFRDPGYAMRRRHIFILAANCTSASSSCFCSSLGTGPRAKAGYDLALTELPDVFVLEIGSEKGAEVLENIQWEPASAFDLGRANQATQRAESEIQRHLRTDDLPRMLYNNLDSPHWDIVGARCLACGNCCMACPTCFCNTVEDWSDLQNKAATRTRVWDSCFLADFSHVHGGNIRPSIRARYRQFLTHKLASWIDQFGTIGCVGCGRCTTWCPVGIDHLEELNAIRATGAK